MHTRILLALPLALQLVTGCREAPHPGVKWSPRFGPVVGHDTIIGRAYLGGRVLLLTDAPALINVDLKGEYAIARAVTGRGADILWGLARLEDG
jgi:hypothetical protein